ncbi:MAG: hypothetical protein WA840_23060 [Caulobacteraceae bacterium]
METQAGSCERCGRACLAGERRPRERIDQERLDYKEAFAAENQRPRGRMHWFAPARRDPGVVLTTPRYRYVRRVYNLCPECDETLAAGETRSIVVQRRGAKIVGWGVLAVAGTLLILQFVWPGFYAALGLEESGPLKPYAKTYIPPSSTPYKPPFDPAVPAESGK